MRSSPGLRCTVFFHSANCRVDHRRIQAGAGQRLAWRLLTAADPRMALSSVALVLTINATVVFRHELALKIAGSEMSHGGIEPLTGLLEPADVLRRGPLTLIGSRSRDDRYLVLIVANLDSFAPDGHDGKDRWQPCPRGHRAAPARDRRRG